MPVLPDPPSSSSLQLINSLMMRQLPLSIGIAAGTIVNRKSEHGGNWLYLEFAKAEQADKALLKHRLRMFSGKQWLAVEPCQDLQWLKSSESNSAGGGGTNQSFAGAAGFGGAPAPASAIRSRPRPLVPINSPMQGTTPRKSQGVRSTVMSYIFGV